LASAAPFQEWSSYTFDKYIQDFGKTYNSDDELSTRRSLFDAELQQVLAQNEEYLTQQSSWYAAMNEFSTWTEDELLVLTKKGPPGSAGPQSSAKLQSVGNPSQFDWREKNIATPVKNQGSCGSCWAFGSTAVLESHYALATGDLAILAPQAYVDCAPNPTHCGGTGGCEGSIPELAFNWSASAGMPLETDYPYQALDGFCKSFKAHVAHDAYVKLPVNEADALETAIATIGPMAVNVAASLWQRYSGGVFSGGCGSSGCTLNHIVAAYGYDTSGDGYWLIRNSWGSSWGEGGYIRLTRANDGTTRVNRLPADGTACEPFPATQTVGGESGVLFDISYPTNARAGTTVSVAV